MSKPSTSNFDDKFTLGFASHEDDHAIRLLLKNSPMTGNISITLEREPSYFTSVATQGKDHCTVVYKNQETGVVAGMGACTIYDSWLNGEITKVGYLSELRFLPNYRGRLSILSHGYQQLLQKGKDKGASVFFTSVFDDNERVIRLFTLPLKTKHIASLNKLPTYIPLDQLHTLIIPVKRQQRLLNLPGVSIRQATELDYNNIISLINGCYSKKSFAPFLNNEMLFDKNRVPNLSVNDFLLAFKDERLIGCLALWDQCCFKQSRVHDYHKVLKTFRHAYNLFAPFLNLVKLPAPGQLFRSAFVSFMAVENDNFYVTKNLLLSAYNLALARKLPNITFGVANRNPNFQRLKGIFPNRSISSTLYAVTDQSERISDVISKLKNDQIFNELTFL